jgi:HPt (histidine-containing phosphotransfer) domain-containing protein
MLSDKSDDKSVVHISAAIKHLIPGYLADISKMLDSAVVALEHQNFTKIKALGHNMFGSGGSYGFDMITEVGESLEQAGQERNEEQIRKCVDKLKDYLERVEVICE